MSYYIPTLNEDILKVDSDITLYSIVKTDGHVWSEKGAPVSFVGIDRGELSMFALVAPFCIIKEKGSTFFAGIGDRKYAHPSYLVGLIAQSSGWFLRNFNSDMGENAYVDKMVFGQVFEITYSKRTQAKAKELAMSLFYGLKECWTGSILDKGS